MKLRRASQQIVALGRELWERRLVMGSSGNLSVRLDDDRLLFTPAGACLRNLSTSNLVVTDLAGTALDPSLRPTSEFLLHVAAYRTRPDVFAVVHTHPTFCVVWSKGSSVLPRDTVGAQETLRDVALTPYRPAGSLALAEEVAAALRRGIDNVLMERHGFTAVSATLENAFVQTDLAEEAARIAYVSRLAGFASGD